MKRLLSYRCLGVGLGLVFLQAEMGCTTAADLQKLDQGVSRKLETLGSTIRTEIAGLRADLGAQEKRQQDLIKALDTVKLMIQNEADNLRRQIAGLQSDTRAVREEIKVDEREREQALRDLAEETVNIVRKAVDEYGAKMQQQLHTLDQSLSTLSAGLAPVPSLVTTLGGEMHSLTHTLVSSYRLEEATLKDRLKALEQVLKQLDSVEGLQQSGVPPSKEPSLPGSQRRQ